MHPSHTAMTTSADVSEAADTKQPFPEHFHSPGPLCHTFSSPFQTLAPPSSVLSLPHQSSFELSRPTCGCLWAPPGLAPIQRYWYALPLYRQGLLYFSSSLRVPYHLPPRSFPIHTALLLPHLPFRAEFPRVACTCVSISSLHILSRASQSDSGFSTDQTAPIQPALASTSTCPGLTPTCSTASLPPSPSWPGSSPGLVLQRFFEGVHDLPDVEGPGPRCWTSSQSF